MQLVELLQQLTTLEFWEHLLDSFQGLGPIAPIVLTALESLIPALPLVGIVTVNVAAHGPLLGFLYSWIGTCLGCFFMFFVFRKLFSNFARNMAEKHTKLAKARNWVSRMKPSALFLILIMPFTPSSFVNFAFGVSDFDAKRYLKTLFFSKLIMIASLTAFGQSLTMAITENPLYLLLAVGLLGALYWISKKIGKKYDV